MSGVSFVITVYNKARFLPELIASLAAQQGNFAREHVFVDDGSKDDSLAVLRAHCVKLANVQIIAQPNGGQNKAANAGLRAARQTFVKLVDADDLLHARCTARLLAALHADPQAVLAHVDATHFDEGAALPDLTAPVAAAPDEKIATPLRALFKSTIANPTQLLVRRSALEQTGGAEERVWNSMEVGLMLKLARLGPFVRAPEVLSFIRTGMSDNLSANQRKLLQESMQHAALFLKDFPDTAPALQRQAAIRIAKRTWLWQLRKRGAGSLSVHSLRRLWAYSPASKPLGVIEACHAAMEEPA
jgi:glycosyltransferase involved in cell wall biosynthesis